MDKPRTVDEYWADLCICRHQRRAHGVHGCIGLADCCPCDSFDLSEDQHVTHVFVGTIEHCGRVAACACEYDWMACPRCKYVIPCPGEGPRS